MTKNCILYYTSWNVDQETDYLKLTDKVTHLLLSFGLFHKEGDRFNIIGSDDMLKYGYKNPTDFYWLEGSYLKWTQLKNKRPNTKILLAFGGASYGYMWDYLEDAKNVPLIMEAIKELSNVDFPVYVKQTSTNQYEKVSTVRLDGVDFDFELSGRPSENQLKNLTTIINSLKEQLPYFLVTLTGYHVSADPIECQWSGSVTSGCTYVGSSHCGELIPLLSATATKLDLYNLMAYDADKNYPWKVAMANHSKYIPAKKLTLGVSLGEQWGKDRNFVESMEELLVKVTSQEVKQYAGIMIWGLCPSSPYKSVTEYIKSINKLVDAFYNA